VTREIAISIAPRENPTRCPYCHGDLLEDEPKDACPGCGAVHHRRCFRDAATCATCARPMDQQPLSALRTRSHAVPLPTLPSRRPRTDVLPHLSPESRLKLGMTLASATGLIVLVSVVLADSWKPLSSILLVDAFILAAFLAPYGVSLAITALFGRARVARAHAREQQHHSKHGHHRR